MSDGPATDAAIRLTVFLCGTMTQTYHTHTRRTYLDCGDGNGSSIFMGVCFFHPLFLALKQVLVVTAPAGSLPPPTTFEQAAAGTRERRPTTAPAPAAGRLREKRGSR